MSGLNIKDTKPDTIEKKLHTDEALMICFVIADEQLKMEQQKEDKIKQIDKDQVTSTNLPFVKIDGIIYKVAAQKNSRLRLYIPNHKTTELIRNYHDPTYMGHFGINATIKQLQQKYY